MDRPEYSVVIEPLSDSEGGGFVALVPDLPGCMSDGETDVQALENARDAIAAWIAQAQAMGRPIPQPTKRRAYA
jgi:predicted RNase H-like HicB family nuclease